MNYKRIGIILLCVTAGFALFLIGFFAGHRYASANREGVSIILQQPQPTETAASQPTEPAVQPTTAPPETAPTEAPAKTNLNTAGKDELQKLPLIGEIKAQAILDYRQEHGKFLSIEQITEVEGIGDGILDKIRDLITVE